MRAGALGVGSTLAGAQPPGRLAVGRNDGRLLEGLAVARLLRIGVLVRPVDHTSPAPPGLDRLGLVGRPLAAAVGVTAVTTVPVQQPVTQLTQSLRHLAQRSAGEDQKAEDPEQDEDDDRARCRHRRGEGAGREEPDDAAGRPHVVGPVRWVGNAVSDVGQPARGEGQRGRSDEQPVGHGRVVGRAQQAEAEEEQDERQRIPDPAEGARHDGVDDVSGHPRHAPPLAGGDDDGQADEEEAHSVTTVLRVEVAGRAADAADGPTRQVRDAHPRAAHRPQRQRQPPGTGRTLAGRGLSRRRTTTSAGRLTRRRHPPGGRARRGGRGTGRHGANATRKSPQTHASHASQRRPGPAHRSARCAPICSEAMDHRARSADRLAVRRCLRGPPHTLSRTRLSPREAVPPVDIVGAVPLPLAQVMSASAQPRLAGQQPSFRGGVLRVTTWPTSSSASGKRGPRPRQVPPDLRSTPCRPLAASTPTAAP